MFSKSTMDTNSIPQNISQQCLTMEPEKIWNGGANVPKTIELQRISPLAPKI